jgi:hypothetical protein
MQSPLVHINYATCALLLLGALASLESEGDAWAASLHFSPSWQAIPRTTGSQCLTPFFIDHIHPIRTPLLTLNSPSCSSTTHLSPSQQQRPASCLSTTLSSLDSLLLASSLFRLALLPFPLCLDPPTPHSRRFVFVSLPALHCCSHPVSRQIAPDGFAIPWTFPCGTRASTTKSAVGLSCNDLSDLTLELLLWNRISFALASMVFDDRDGLHAPPPIGRRHTIFLRQWHGSVHHVPQN